ncbi:MAG: hypothetical protein ACI85I_002032 [Arenicella sp.]|jgi:hypothetical protein
MPQEKYFTIALKVAISIVILCRVLILLRAYQYLGLEEFNLTFCLNGLQVLAILIILVLYPIRFYKKTEKQLDDYLKLMLVVFYLLFSFSNLYHLPQETILSYLTIGTFCVWLIIGLFNSLRMKKDDEKSLFMALPTQLGSLSIAVFGIGIFIRIGYYPYGDWVLLAGTVLLILWIFEAEWRKE